MAQKDMTFVSIQKVLKLGKNWNVAENKSVNWLQCNIEPSWNPVFLRN